MHGLKLFGIASLVAKDPTAVRPSSTALSMGTVDNNTPSHEDAVFGRRRALQSIFGTAAAVTIGAQASNALDMDAFMSSEVSLPYGIVLRVHLLSNDVFFRSFEFSHALPLFDFKYLPY